MTGLYRVGTAAYHGMIALAARFGHRQARQWVQGRQEAPSARQIREQISNQFGTASPPVVWVHAASLGEWEQGRPIVEVLRQHHPTWQFVLSFFSPSGYERCKDTDAVHHVTYLPPDGPKRAEEWMSDLRPSLAIFIKYEFWFFHLRALHRASVPTFLVAASFRPKQSFFRPAGDWWRAMLALFTGIITQTEQDRELLTGLGEYPAERAMVGGDPRMDRTLALAQAPFHDPIVEAFAAGGLTIVAGSVWIEDLVIWWPVWQRMPASVRLILAPHQLVEKELAQTQVQWKAERYTKTSADDVAGSRVLLLDTIGILSRVYRYGDLAYVGGGFRTGLHNTLEPLAYGLPTIFGPRHEKFPEAAAAIREGGAFSVGSDAELFAVLEQLQQAGPREVAAEAQRRLAQVSAGAAERTARQVMHWMALSLALLFWAIPGTCVRAQPELLPSQSTPTPPDDRLESALNAAFEKGNLMVALAGVEWRRGLALVAGTCPTGESLALEVTLEANVNYAFLASAESGAYDVDLLLRDGNGQLVAQDTELDGTPILEFRPAQGGTYQLQVHAVSGPDPRSHLGLSLLRSGGLPVLERDFRTLSDVFFASVAGISKSSGAAWLQVSGQWCLFGYLLDEGRGETLRRIRPGPGKGYFVASGGNNFRDIDLYLADEEQRIVLVDTAPNAFPLLEYVFPANAPYELRVEVERSRNPGLLLLGLLKE